MISKNPLSGVYPLRKSNLCTDCEPLISPQRSDPAFLFSRDGFHPFWKIEDIMMKSVNLPHRKIILVTDEVVDNQNLLKPEALVIIYVMLSCYELETLQPISVIPVRKRKVPSETNNLRRG